MIKTKGIVIREIKYGDTSKILNIYTDELGKISVLVRGAYNPKSKLIANTQTFALNEFHFKKGKNFYYINEADLLNSYYNIREKFERMILGYYILELIDKSVPMEQKNENIYNMLEKALEILVFLDEDYLKFIIAYEIKFISFLGYRPFLESCVNCNSNNLDKFKFSLLKGGVICEKCFNEDRHAMIIDELQLKLLKILLYTPLDKLDGVEASENSLIRLHNILVRYILYSIDRKEFKSLELLEGIF